MLLMFWQPAEYQAFLGKRGKMEAIKVACVASVSNRVIAQKLERKQKKVEGGGGGEKRKRLPANPTTLENAP